MLFIAEIVWLTLGMIWVCTNYSTCPAKAPKRAVLGEYKPYFVNLAFTVHSHVPSVFAVFFHFCCPILENGNVKCRHHQLLPQPQDPFLTFDKNRNADVMRKQGFGTICCERTLCHYHCGKRCTDVKIVGTETAKETLNLLVCSFLTLYHISLT